MTGERGLFQTMDESVQLKVGLGDGKQVQIEGKGTIAIKTKSGIKKLIHDVYYIPGLAHNLLSMGQLIQKGYLVHFHDGMCEIKNIKSENSIFKVHMTENKMFPLELSCLDDCAMVANVRNESRLWHLRYGHLHFNGLKLLGQKNMVMGLPSIGSVDSVCGGCVYGKQRKLPFPIGKAWRARMPLKLVHADICGSTKTLSLNNSKYFLLFTDDFSRMSWVFFLGQKFEAFEKFKEFKAFAEKQSGYAIKTLRTDRGESSYPMNLLSFCKENGIRRQLTIRKTPKQNGVVERKNRTVVEMARSMLNEKELPNSFWTEAVATAIHLLNISPTKAVRNQTPYEVWLGVNPNVSNLKVFGSIAYALIDSTDRTKLEKKSEKCIFVGYSAETKGYRLYNPLTKKLNIRRDVIFDENIVWQQVGDKDHNISFVDDGT